MPFSPIERQALLQVKGVGPTVVDRLETMGFESLAQLARADALDVVAQVVATLREHHWKNSPKSRAAIASAIAMAQSRPTPPTQTPTRSQPH